MIVLIVGSLIVRLFLLLFGWFIAQLPHGCCFHSLFPILHSNNLKELILDFAFDDPVKRGVATPGRASAYKLAICKGFQGYFLRDSTSHYCRAIVQHRRRQEEQDLQTDAIGYITVGSDLLGTAWWS